MDSIGLSVSDAGVVLGGNIKPLSRATIYRRIADGTLDARKVGGRTIITVESVRNALANAPRMGK